MGFWDSQSEIIVKVKDKTYTLEQTQQIFEDWNLSGDAPGFLKITKTDLITRLENPNVNLILIASRGIKTPRRLEYDYDLYDLVKNNEYGEPKKEYGHGDDTVSSNSLIIPGLKWAWEFDNKKKNAKPVKIVDYCSVFNEKYTPYDQTFSDQEFQITRNEFFGIQCDCQTSKK